MVTHFLPVLVKIPNCCVRTRSVSKTHQQVVRDSLFNQCIEMSGLCCFPYSNVCVNFWANPTMYSLKVTQCKHQHRVQPDKTQTTSQSPKAVPDQSAPPQACLRVKGTQYFCVGSPQVVVTLSI